MGSLIHQTRSIDRRNTLQPAQWSPPPIPEHPIDNKSVTVLNFGTGYSKIEWVEYPLNQTMVNSFVGIDGKAHHHL
jgi:hypothetical protein